MLDDITRPAHYVNNDRKNVIECWDFILGLYDPSFLLGNAIKYVTRAGRKGSQIPDYMKAIEYLKKYAAEQEKDFSTHYGVQKYADSQGLSPEQTAILFKIVDDEPSEAISLIESLIRSIRSQPDTRIPCEVTLHN